MPSRQKDNERVGMKCNAEVSRSSMARRCSILASMSMEREPMRSVGDQTKAHCYLFLTHSSVMLWVIDCQFIKNFPVFYYNFPFVY